MIARIFDDAGSGGCKLCWITVGRQEAALLIESLATQLASGDSNTARLESRCRGAFGEMSIVVHSEEKVVQ